MKTVFYLLPLKSTGNVKKVFLSKLKRWNFEDCKNANHTVLGPSNLYVFQDFLRLVCHSKNLTLKSFP